MNANLTAVKKVIDSYESSIIGGFPEYGRLHLLRTDLGIVSYALDVKYHSIGRYYKVTVYCDGKYSEFKVNKIGYEVIVSMVKKHDIKITNKVNHINKVIGETESIINITLRNRGIGVLKELIRDNLEGLTDEFLNDVKAHIHFDYNTYYTYLDKVKMMKDILSLV